ncbi:sn-glycerol-1-phosphate dehydrogenase [Aquibacillus salsiterrae]|uniref:Sn-glycerol-1-phosphate dehydrogenase n=1 Tax=Aquibacillus salsiterrae TaxID=2950439 RepID=A0A9X3WDR6_9BACI|nr:sn-glycerol-1-phosphate dehydrogenase [Aquibacillus salsiterrae]MDC3416853.1 sn-glycerol-1-phosphate dehydrogenase [Aquibacillus salsiterrae]
MDVRKQLEQLCKELNVTDVNFPEITVQNKAIELVPPYLTKQGYERIVLVVDYHTKKVAGDHLASLLTDVFETTIVNLQPNNHGQVIADEQAMVQLMIETPHDTDVFLAVGSGTIHDIVRFAGYKMDIPFISIPTAASVDGFTSKGAPLILRGVKQTIQTASPMALFADIDILKAAPKEMTAAGFGDILGKYTSLLDWKISDLIGKEPYYQLAADMTRASLEKCVNNAEKIANADDEGIEILIHSLIESGLVMLVLDFSRPASGGEHHLSHYWEMDLLDKDAHQLLHGAKVGVTTTIISDLYRKMLPSLAVDTSNGSELVKLFRTHFEEIKQEIDALPSVEELRGLLKLVGGPTTPEELDIDVALVRMSLNEAFKLRERCTGLYIINQLKKEEIPYPI